MPDERRKSDKRETMLLPPSHFDLVLSIFVLRRKHTKTEYDEAEDENDLRDAITALEKAAFTIVPAGTIAALKNTINDLNGLLARRSNTEGEGS